MSNGVIDWLLPSILNTLTTAAGPLVTPWLNKHVVGSGIISWYFIGSAILCFISSIIFSNGIQLPEPWILVAGILFGAGILSVQKTSERAPEPAIAIAIPSSRAFLTAFLSMVFIGTSTSGYITTSYIIQAILSILLVVITHYETPKSEPTQWYVYTAIATILLSLSDVILKSSGSYDTVWNDTFWFSLAGSLFALIMNYKKTGSLFPAYRETGTVEPDNWFTVFMLMIGVFFVRLITQVYSIAVASNPAYPRMIEAFVVPIVAIVSQYSESYKMTTQELGILAAMTGVSVYSSYLNITQNPL